MRSHHTDRDHIHAEEPGRLLMRGGEERENVGLKLDIQKTKIIASGPITSWEIDGETVETVSDYFLGLQNHCRWDYSHEHYKHTLLKRTFSLEGKL